MTDAMSQVVTYSTAGPIATLELNRPAARNAVNGAVAAAVESCLDDIEGRTEIRVAIICANTSGQERPVFCAGADLKAIAAGETSMSTERGGFAGFTHRQRRTPVIAAVDGLATAGGCEIVLAADIVVATTRSSFGLAEVKRNLIAAAGGLYRLPRAIGPAAAMEAILTGEPLDASRAYSLGLISRLVGPGEALDEARRVATQIATCAPLAVQESRAIAWAAVAGADDEKLDQLVGEARTRLATSNDRNEGLAAFIERRAPRWTGN